MQSEKFNVSDTCVCFAAARAPSVISVRPPPCSRIHILAVLSPAVQLSVGQDRTAHFIKFTIHSGWDDFCVVHNVSVEGASSGGATGFAN